MWSSERRVLKTEQELLKVRPFNITSVEDDQKDCDKMRGDDREEERKRIEEKAYEKGFSDGLSAGRLQVLQEIEKEVMIIQSLISQIEEHRKNIYREIESEIVEMSLAIAKKIVYMVADRDHETVLRIVREAIKRTTERETLRIRVNPEDFEVINSDRINLLKCMDGIKNIIIEKDDSIQRGGCLIETHHGDIDGRIDTQINVIEEEIRKELQSNDKSK